MIKQGVILLFMMASLFSLGQAPQIIKLEKLQQLISEKNDQIKIFNFWATWCAPCVKELPLFEKFGQQHPEIKIYLVSMDIDLDPDVQKVFKFVERKKLNSNVLILDEQDPNAWISKIDNHWQGSLPATLVINTKSKKRKFVGKELHDGELEALIEEIK